MNTYWKMVSKFGLSALGLLALSACGGGGAAGSGNPGPAAAPTMLSGVASKGLVKDAKVMVCRIVNGTVQADASCLSTTSGKDGSFSVTLSDGFTGPVLVKVMAGVGSMMLDETTGGDIPYSMTLRAMVPALSASTAVYVTPFSEMVANAMGTSSIDADKIRQAMGTVQTLMSSLGIDLSVMPMVDLKNSSGDATLMGQQANMVAQLTKVVMAAKSSSLLTNANGVACNAAATAADQQVACAVNMMAGLMTGPTTFDRTKADAMMAALLAQNVTATNMPIIMANGTVGMQLADLTSVQSLQTAMQNAGMSSAIVASTVTGMMSGMHLRTGSTTP